MESLKWKVGYYMIYTYRRSLFPMGNGFIGAKSGGKETGLTIRVSRWDDGSWDRGSNGGDEKQSHSVCALERETIGRGARLNAMGVGIKKNISLKF